MEKALQHINLSRYLLFLQACTEHACALVIYNQSGIQQALASTESFNEISDVLHSISQLELDWKSVDQQSNTNLLSEALHICFASLIIGAEEQQYWLAGVVQRPLVAAIEQPMAEDSILMHIARCVAEDYMQLLALNGMADELAVRYEELNLLYGMNDFDAENVSQDEKAALTQLIGHSIDYLNVDLAILYIPELEINIHQARALQATDYELLINIVYQQVVPYLGKHQGTLVINQMEEDEQIEWSLKIPYKILVSPIANSNQRLIGILLLINDLQKPDFSHSDRKLCEIMALEASKLTQARRDSITGQLNRRGLTENLERIIAESKTSTDKHCLLLINLDQFKLINDSAGQHGGDQLIRQVNSLIQKYLKSADVLGRLGADEFAVLLHNCDIEDAKNIAERIREVIKQFRYFYHDKLFDISACVGVVELNAEFKDFSDALRAADLACSVAKEQGRNRVHVFEKNDENLELQRNLLQWVSRINIGIEENHFQLYRQKIIPLKPPAGRDHYEILLRLQDGKGEIVEPDQFIPAAERFNLMSKLDRWVVFKTLEFLAQFEKVTPTERFSCSINLSGQSFCEENFSADIINEIIKSGVSPSVLCFEITETAAVSNMSQAVEFIKKLKAIGCRFALDDFGSGMSSFTYLKNLPVDYLKIDGFFVRTMLENDIDKTMVSAIHEIGSAMGIKTIAEFVENQEIMAVLQSMGIDYGQGYAIGKPEPFVINFADSQHL